MGNTHSGSYSNFKPRKNVHWKTAGKPSPPGKPEIKPLLGEDDLNTITLKWLNSDDGGAPLHGYQVECNRVGSPDWIHTSPPVVTKPELILSGLDPGFKYQFRVVALNAVGMSEFSKISDILTVSTDSFPITIPKFTSKIQDIVCLENEKTDFEITFEGNPMPAISWFKDGYEIFSSRRTAILTENNNSVLTFHQALLSDEGEIKCTATNRAGHIICKARLIINSAPKLRYPRQYEDGLLYEVNETIFLKTSVVGKPVPKIEWRHDGLAILSGDRIEISSSEKFSILKINSAQRKDRGEYQIHALNSVGEDIASFLVTITAPPDPPQNIAVIRQIDKSVTLSWNPPFDDGGCKIGNYIIEYYRTGWNVWLKAATSRKLSVTLFDLIEGSEYRFRVKAESPYGVSIPGDESSRIIIPKKAIGLTYSSNDTTTKLITTDYLKTEYNEKLPLILPRKKRSVSPKLEDNVIEIRSEKKIRKGVHSKKIEPLLEINKQVWREKPESKSPTGSNEFMLILCPEQNEKKKENLKSFQLDLEDALSPPELSLSAPNIASPFSSLRPLRNSVSSTELLHERAMDRFYKAVAMKQELSYISNKSNTRYDILSKPIEKNPNNTLNNMNVSFENLEVEKIDDDSKTLNETDKNTSNHFVSVNVNGKWHSISFEEDYTESTVSTGSEMSEIGSFHEENINELNEKNNTMDNNIALNEAQEMIEKPKLILKPILKKTNNNFITYAANPTIIKESDIKIAKNGPKSNILRKITKMPLQKSFNFPKLKLKKNIKEKNVETGLKSDLNTNVLSNKSSANPLHNPIDERRTIIEHYGNIVKEYGNKKNNTQIYLDRDELKKAAETNNKQNVTQKSQGKRKIKVNNNCDSPLKMKENLSKYKKNKNSDKLNFSTINLIEKNEANKSISRVSIFMPIDYKELETVAKYNVRSAINYIVDVCLLLLAVWVYVFRSEWLAIPVLILIVYRQIKDFQNYLYKKLPAWLTTKMKKSI